MTNGIHFRMVVKSTCLNNMYHYRYQERTPNSLQLSKFFGEYASWIGCLSPDFLQ